MTPREIKQSNRIGSVMVSMLASSVADGAFEPKLGQAKEHTIGSCCFSARHTALMRRSNYWLAWSEATYLPADCCISEIALYKYYSGCWSSTKQTSSYYH